MLVRDLADLPDRVYGAAVDVADLRAHDRRPFSLVERRPQRRRPHAALVVAVHRDDGRATHAEEPQRPVDAAAAPPTARPTPRPSRLDSAPRAGRWPAR